jgi:hypothetical protein
LGGWSARRKASTCTLSLNVHDLSGIRTHDPGFRPSEESACLRPLGYRDRHCRSIFKRYPLVTVFMRLYWYNCIIAQYLRSKYAFYIDSVFGHYLKFYYYSKRFGDWTLHPSSGKKPTQLRPSDRASPHPRTTAETQSNGYKPKKKTSLGS